MTYESEVGIAVIEKHADMFTRTVLNTLGEPDLCISLLSNPKTYIAVFYRSYNWSEKSDSVLEILDYLKTLNSNQFGFIRVGESLDDPVERLGSPWLFRLEAQRSIHLVDHRWSLVTYR